MAKVTVSPVALSLNSSASRDTEAMTTDHAEMVSGEANKLVILACNTDTSDAMTVTVKAGDYSSNSLGDLEVSIPLSSSKLIGPFESARFEDSDGKIQVETSSTGTLSGTIEAFYLP